MGLSKFLSLLDKSALFFVRLDRLSQLDPFEGYYTSANVRTENLKFSDIPKEWLERADIIDERMYEVLKEGIKQSRELAKREREATFVNSWHAQEHESAAMWNLYVKSQEGIALQSTYQPLIDSFESYRDFNIFVGMVKYIDYENEIISIWNSLSPFTHKRKSFKHEEELRALIWTPQDRKNMIGFPPQNLFCDTDGLYVSVDLDRLIDRIYVAPVAPHWILDLLRSVVKKYGLAKEVIQSDLASTPIY